MGLATILLSVFAVTLIIIETEAAGSCPLPSKVYSCSPKCKENYECTHGKLCCQNGCNAKSCSEPAGQGQGTGEKGSKYGGGGAGVYCEGAKCSSGEVCKMDPSTKRQKCQRA